jgi:uncharacterized protein (DUF983 family)
MFSDINVLEITGVTELIKSQEAGIENLCPKCKTGKMDYDGLLNYFCQKCGYTLAGCFT